MDTNKEVAPARGAAVGRRDLICAGGVVIASCLLAPANANVAFAPLDAKRVAQVAALLDEAPAGFGPTYHDRPVWDALRTRPAFGKVIPAAVKLLTEPFPAWDDDAYLDFSRTGQRPRGEAMMGARHKRLSPLVWAECLENKGRFVAAIEATLHEYAGEKSWTLPAHDGKLTNFHQTAYYAELGSALFAHDIAQALYMLGDKISPASRQEILSAMEAHIFAPVRTQLKTGQGGNWWLTTTNNWNAVCLRGVTGAALTVIPDRHDRAFFATAAERYSRNSIEGFNNDGYCTEGLGYYDYGFGNYLQLREKLYQATGGKIDLFADPKVRKIAQFGPNLEIINGSWPARCDCRIGTVTDTSILYYCSRVLGLGLKAYESLDLASPGTLSTGTMFTFPNSASASKPSAVAAAPVGVRSYFDDPESGVLVVRPAPGSACRLGAAFSGGNNAKSHNHNDLGSFTVVLGKAQLVGDPGGPYAYTAKTFGPERYTAFKIFGSYAHPVPVVAGKQQVPGAKALARVVKTDFADTADAFVLDLVAAYPAGTVKKLIRTFHYDRQGAGALTIHDEFVFDRPEMFETALTTHAQAWKQIAPDTLEFTGGGERLIARITAPAESGGFTLASEVIEENCVPFTRIGLRLNRPLAGGGVAIQFAPG